jgi:hypothetical protein
MEPMIRRIDDLLDEQVKRNMTIAESVLSISGDREGPFGCLAQIVALGT